jgi:hypothetical protein
MEAHLRVANPVIGDQANLPTITTIPFIWWKESTHFFLVDKNPLLQIRAVAVAGAGACAREKSVHSKEISGGLGRSARCEYMCRGGLFRVGNLLG